MEIKLLVNGGAMKPGPAVAQKLGPLGIPINKVIEEVNKKTKSFSGMEVPVVIDVNTATKEFEIEVLSPPTSGLLKKEAGVEKGSGLQDRQKMANLSIEQIISVALQKKENLLCRDLKASVKIVIGSCVSLGFLVEGMNAKEVITLVNEGKYDKEINGEITETPEEKRKEMDSYFDKLKIKQTAIIEAEKKVADEKAAK